MGISEEAITKPCWFEVLVPGNYQLPEGTFYREHAVRQCTGERCGWIKYMDGETWEACPWSEKQQRGKRR